MKYRAIVWVVALLGLVDLARGAASLESLRLQDVQKDSFDYFFASHQEWADGQKMLAFNHRSGRTFFVKPGESLEGYRVVRFEPRMEKVFVPSVNAEQAVRTGRVTLRGEDGREVVLEQGKRLEQAGWRAWVVGLDTGFQWSVREGDVIFDGEGSGRVVRIRPDALWVDFGSGEAAVAKISAGERAAVAELWAAQREEQRIRQALAAARDKKAEPVRQQAAQVVVAQNAGGAGNLAAGRVVGVAGSEPHMFIGTEYRYPTEYQVWYVRQGTNQTIRPLVVPRKFESRMVGGTVGPGPDFTWTSVSPVDGAAGSGVPYRSSMTPYPYPLPRVSRFEYKVRP